MTQDGALTIQTQCGAQEKTHSALEHSCLLAFLKQLSQVKLLCLRKARGTQALGHSEVQGMLPCPHPCECSSWDLSLSAPELGPPVQFT